MNFLVLDVGTSSMRGILFRHNGSAMHMIQKKYNVISLEHGWMEQNPMVLKKSMFEIVKEINAFAITRREQISAVVLTSQRSSVIPVDENGNHLCNAQMWQDKRTLPLCQEMEKYNKKIFEICGSRINPVFSGMKMKWLKINKMDIYTKAYKLTVIADYLIYHMTGNFYTDYTYGSRSLLMNLKTNTWDQRLIDMLEIDKEKLCELKPSGSVMGYTTDKFACQTGIAADIPVISAGGDQQCSMLGQGCVEPGLLSLTLGTGGFLLTSVKKVPENLNWDVVCNASSVTGEYILEANVLTCTSALEWFKHNFHGEESEFYDRLDYYLKVIPAGSHGCRALPYFQGRSTPDWNSNATAAFTGITLNTSREDMLKALMESICMEINNHIISLLKYVPIEKILINGGLSNSEAFNQMQADIYGKNIIRKDHTESTAIGAFLMAAVTMKKYKNVKEAFDSTQKNVKSKEYAFRPQQNEIYKIIGEEMNSIYNNIYKAAERRYHE